MSGKKEVSYEAVNEFIIAIKCWYRSLIFSAMEVIQRFLREYDSSIVNRLETQTRQPSLYFAAILIDHEQSYELMRLLISQGANAHFKDNYQQTILFYVCREGKEKCLDLLLEQGLNLNDEDIYGQTPLFYAAK
jgi:ankyrin repeat protein